MEVSFPFASSVSSQMAVRGRPLLLFGFAVLRHHRDEGTRPADEFLWASLLPSSSLPSMFGTVLTRSPEAEKTTPCTAPAANRYRAAAGSRVRLFFWPYFLFANRFVTDFRDYFRRPNWRDICIWNLRLPVQTLRAAAGSAADGAVGAAEPYKNCSRRMLARCKVGREWVRDIWSSIEQYRCRDDSHSATRVRVDSCRPDQICKFIRIHKMSKSKNWAKKLANSKWKMILAESLHRKLYDCSRKWRNRTSVSSWASKCVVWCLPMLGFTTKRWSFEFIFADEAVFFFMETMSEIKCFFYCYG